MSVILKKNSIRATATTLLVLLVAILSLVQQHSVDGAIVITKKEESCLRQTGEVFENADQDLLQARHDFTISMEMDMTSDQKMKAEYPMEQLKNYDSFCTKYGGKLHIIKIDFFDCLLRGTSKDIELTLRNFANCMADVDDCDGFGQEHLLQEAWEELGLHCDLEEEETKKDPPKDKGNDNKPRNDDIAKKEKEAAAKGADDVDKEEKQAEYVPKEEQDKNGKKKKKGGFMKFVLFVSVCGAGFFVYDKRRRGQPIELPFGLSSRIPFGGVSTSRFARRAQPGFVSDYNLLSSAEDNSLQLSNNFA